MGTVRWEGKAIAVAQVDTITVAGVWAAADTATVTMNGKALVLTLGAGALVTVSDVALSIQEMLTDGNFTDPNVTSNGIGDEVPEFNEITWTINSAVITATHGTKGTEFAFTAAETTTGSGTATKASVTSADGPNNVGNAVNWDTGVLPADDDDIVVDDGAISMLYGLTALVGIAPESITLGMGYTGKIGLPQVNSNGYPEYRQRYLQICDAAPTSTRTEVNIGGGIGSGSNRLFFEFGALGPVDINVINTASAENSDMPTFSFIGGVSSSTLAGTKGSVGVAVIEGETANLAAIKASYKTNQSSDLTLTLGPDLTYNSSVITMNGGTVYNYSTSALAQLEQVAGVFNHRGGAITLQNNMGGTFNDESTGTLAEVHVSDGATFEGGKDLRTKTITTLKIYKGATFKDPTKRYTFTNDVDLVQCSLSDVTLDLGGNLTLARSAI